MSGAAPPVPSRVIVPFLVITLIWGSTWMAIRYQLGVVDPAWSLCYRFLTASVAMFVYGLWIKAPLGLDRGGMIRALLLGATLFFGNYNSLYHAEKYVTSGVVAMVFALLVVPNALFGRIFLGIRVTRDFIFGSIVAFGGMALLFAHELNHAASGGSAALFGFAMIFAGILSASIGNVMQAGEKVRALPPVAFFAWSMGMGAVLNAIVGLIVAGPPAIDLGAPYLLSMLYLGIFGSAVTFPLYFFIIGEIGPARAAYTGVLTPIIAMVLSTLFEDYRWSLIALAGSALALLGLFIALRARNPAR